METKKTNMKHIFTLFTALLLTPPAWAVTKEEYRAASINGVRESGNFGRAKNMVRAVLAGTKDGKIAVVGRGEIMFVSRLLVAGRLTNDTELLGLAKDIVLGIQGDGFAVADDGIFGNRCQILVNCHT